MCKLTHWLVCALPLIFLPDFRQPETVKRVPPKNYSESFFFKPEQLRILRTK